MPIGDVFRMTSWKHRFTADNFLREVGFKCTHKNEVGVFLLLGHEDKDGKMPLDLEKAMNNLGWFREGTIVKRGKKKP